MAKKPKTYEDTYGGEVAEGKKPPGRPKGSTMKGPTKDDLRDINKELSGIIDKLIDKLAVSVEAADKTTAQMTEANTHIGKLINTINANVNLSTKSVALLDKTFEEKKFIESLKRGNEDQTKAMSGLNLGFRAFSSIMSGIFSGLEPVFDVMEEVGEMIGEALRPLMSTIAEGLITFLPLLQIGLDALSFVLTPLAEAIKQLLLFLNPFDDPPSVPLTDDEIADALAKGFAAGMLSITGGTEQDVNEFNTERNELLQELVDIARAERRTSEFG